MSSIQELVESHHKALRNWLQKAMERNHQVDDDKVVWCRCSSRKSPQNTRTPSAAF